MIWYSANGTSEDWHWDHAGWLSGQHGRTWAVKTIGSGWGGCVVSRDWRLGVSSRGRRRQESQWETLENSPARARSRPLHSARRSALLLTRPWSFCSGVSCATALRQSTPICAACRLTEHGTVWTCSTDRPIHLTTVRSPVFLDTYHCVWAFDFYWPTRTFCDISQSWVRVDKLGLGSKQHVSSHIHVMIWEDIHTRGHWLNWVTLWRVISWSGWCVLGVGGS